MINKMLNTNDDDKHEDVLFTLNVLLKRKRDVELYFRKLPDKIKEEIKSDPIYRLYEQS